MAHNLKLLFLKNINDANVSSVKFCLHYTQKYYAVISYIIILRLSNWELPFLLPLPPFELVRGLIFSEKFKRLFTVCTCFQSSGTITTIWCTRITVYVKEWGDEDLQKQIASVGYKHAWRQNGLGKYRRIMKQISNGNSLYTEFLLDLLERRHFIIPYFSLCDFGDFAASIQDPSDFIYPSI